MTNDPSLSRRSLLGGALGAASIAAAPPLAAAAPAPVRRAPRDLRPGGALDRLVAEMAAKDEFSGAVLVAHRGRPVLIRAHGMADKRRSIPNRPDTIFNIGSVTKLFTGLAVAQLAAQGKLELHAKLGTYLDGFPAEIADAVTVHHLLTHTSGLGRDPVGPGAGPSPAWDSVDEVWDGTMAVIRALLQTKFTPGSGWAYSNDGFWVLGAIVAQASGMTFYDYVRQHVFAPAGMRRTDFHTRPQVLASRDIAHRYRRNPATGERVDFTTSANFGFVGGPDGGADSTADDLLRFATALQADQLLDRPFTDLVTSGKVPRPTRPDAAAASHHFVGYGFVDEISSGQRVFGHSGSGPGVDANLDIFPDLDWVTVVLSNYENAINPIVDLARQLIARPG